MRMKHVLLRTPEYLYRYMAAAAGIHGVSVTAMINWVLQCCYEGDYVNAFAERPPGDRVPHRLTDDDIPVLTRQERADGATPE